MGFYRGPQIVKEGLVLYLDAANTKSYTGTGTVWKDLSGNGNNGTLINGPTFDSGNNGSIVFDGVNDYVTGGGNITNSLFSENNYTLCTWFNWRGGGGGSDRRNYLFQNGGSNFPLSLEINSRDFNPPRFATWQHTTTGSIHHNSTHTVNQNQWYNFVVSNGISNTIKMFVNGNEIFSTSVRSGDLLSFSGFRIGTHRSNDNRWFDGKISQTQIYNRALSPQEILQNYNSTKGRYGL
jgi:hypothetical protein